MAFTSGVLDIYQYLLDNGFAGGSSDFGLVRRFFSDHQDRLVVVTEDGGARAEVPAGTGVGSAALVDIGVLVQVRGLPHEADSSFDKAEDIRIELNGQFDVSINGRKYIRVRALTPEPVFAGFDDNARPLHNVALRLMKDAPVVEFGAGFSSAFAIKGVQ